MKSSEILKSYRGKALLTQDDLASMLKVSRSTYSNWENNPLQCPINIIFNVLNELNVDIDDFLNALKQDYKSCRNTD